jgi:mRNA interferase MazF
VAAITTSSGKAYPFQVSLENEECGLNRPSTILLEQILTVDKRRLVEKIGQIGPEKLHEVEKAVHNSLGLSW